MRIKQIKIEKLFGLEKNNFDIACYPNEYITILYAFNGTGKTTLLRLIDAVLDVKLQVLDSIPFKKIELFFDNGDSVCVEKNGEYKKSFKETKVKDLYCFDSKGTLKQFEGKEDEIPVYPISYTTVLDKKDEKYYLQFSRDFAQQVREEYEKDSRQIIKYNSKSINTLEFHYRSPIYFEIDINNKENNVFNKLKKSLTKKIQIKGIFANKDYNRLFCDEPAFEKTTNFINQIFELPVFENYNLSDTIYLDKHEIEKIYSYVMFEKNDFKTTDEKKRIPEDSKKIILFENHQKWPYILPDKTELVCKKNQELLNKNETAEVDKFINLINQNFIMEFKMLARNKNNELVIVPAGPYKDFDELPLSILSSGEKNLIVLFYELMFITPEKEFPKQDIIVLIDEPESSLHISWERNILKNIIPICEEKNIQVLIATHSPAIDSGYLNLQSPMISERYQVERD